MTAILFVVEMVFEIHNFYFMKGLEKGKPADPVSIHPVVTHGTEQKTFPLFNN